MAQTPWPNAVSIVVVLERSVKDLITWPPNSPISSHKSGRINQAFGAFCHFVNDKTALLFPERWKLSGLDAE